MVARAEHAQLLHRAESNAADGDTVQLPAGRLRVRLPHPQDPHPEYFRAEIVGSDDTVLRDLDFWPSLREAREVVRELTASEETVLRYLGLLAKVMYSYSEDQVVLAEVFAEVFEVLLPALATVQVVFEGEPVRVELASADQARIARRPVAVWRNAQLVLDGDLVLRPYSSSVSCRPPAILFPAGNTTDIS